jgi:Flp pilus assembly protein TadG
MRKLIPFARFASDRRGIAAAEFALIAPALIFLVMGVFEMSFRFRASEEATRYVHQVADLVSRESDISGDYIKEVFSAAEFMMKPLNPSENLDLDVSSVGFDGSTGDPSVYWRRVVGTAVSFDPEEARTMGVDGESVIRVGVRYQYQSVLTELFGGSHMTLEKSAYARPRIDRKIEMDNKTNDGGAVVYLTVN